MCSIFLFHRKSSSTKSSRTSSRSLHIAFAQACFKGFSPGIPLDDLKYSAKLVPVMSLLKRTRTIWWPHLWMPKNWSNTGSKMDLKTGLSLFLCGISNEVKVFQALVACFNHFFRVHLDHFLFSPFHRSRQERYIFVILRSWFTNCFSRTSSFIPSDM